MPRPVRRTATRSSSTSLRVWQDRALVAMRSWTSGPFLISAAPGAGKTRPALDLARQLLRDRAVRRVVVVCPTTPLTAQWAQAVGGRALGAPVRRRDTRDRRRGASPGRGPRVGPRLRSGARAGIAPAAALRH